MLALDAEQPDVVHRALAGVLFGVGAAAHRFQRGKAGVEQDPVQVRDVQPETSALSATVEDALLAVGE